MRKRDKEIRVMMASIPTIGRDQDTDQRETKYARQTIEKLSDELTRSQDDAKDAYGRLLAAEERNTKMQIAIEDALTYPDVDETMCPWCDLEQALEGSDTSER